MASSPPSISHIDRLIQNLGSDHYEVREAATQALAKMEEAIPALKKARHSSAPEIRRRVEAILLELKRKQAPRELARAHVLCRAGRIIQAADRLAYWGEWDRNGNSWECITRFADQAIASTADYFPPQGGFRQNMRFPAGGFERFANLVRPEEICQRSITIDATSDPRHLVKTKFNLQFVQKTKGSLLLRGETIIWSSDDIEFGMITGMVAASGDVELTSARDSVIIAGGDLTKIKSLYRVIIVCDGDVELLRPPAECSLIIARGKVTCAHGKLKKCMIRSGHSLRLLDGRMIDLKDEAHDPLAFVTFFELADVGLLATDLDPRSTPGLTGIRLREIQDKSPFRSRLQPGDVVTALEGDDVKSTEHFRRLLRRKLAQGGPILTLSVQREGRSQDVSIPLKD